MNVYFLSGHRLVKAETKLKDPEAARAFAQHLAHVDLMPVTSAVLAVIEGGKP